MSTASGGNNIKWPMVAAIHNSITYTLCNLYTALLKNSVHPVHQKMDMCIVIPKQGKKEKAQAKSYNPISLLSTLSRTLEKIVAHRLAHIAVQIRAIDDTQMGSRAQHSAQDTLFRILTPAQTWLEPKKDTVRYGILHPTILANDIDGAFNTVRYERLHDVISLSGLQTCLGDWVYDLCSDRTFCFHFDGEPEIPKIFDSGLPQGSPLLPILFVIYSAPTIRRRPGRNEIDSMYVGDDTILLGATSESFVIKRLQERLNTRIERA